MVEHQKRGGKSKLSQPQNRVLVNNVNVFHEVHVNWLSYRNLGRLLSLIKGHMYDWNNHSRIFIMQKMYHHTPPPMMNSRSSSLFAH